MGDADNNTVDVAELINYIESRLPKWRLWFPNEGSTVEVERRQLLALVEAVKERDKLAAFKAYSERLREIIRYWSYCTYTGMRRECPEKESEFLEVFRELGIQPYASVPEEVFAERDALRAEGQRMPGRTRITARPAVRSTGGRSRMNYDLKKPCAHCPFRTDCRPGWLGRSRAQEIATAITDQQATFACHETTVEGEDGEQKETNDSQHCAGAMILLEKINRPNQMMRICERLGLYDRTKLDMDAPVFDTPKEFVKHHGKRRAKGDTPS
jgi:hypothetical protein